MTQTETTKNESSKDAAMALLKPGHTMTLEQEKQILEEARAQLKIVLENATDDKGFHSGVTATLASSGGVKISSKSEGAYCIAKGSCLAPEGMTVHDVRKQFSNDLRNNQVMDRVLKRIDPMTTVMTGVTELKHTELLDESKQEHLRVIYGNFYVAPLICDRDICVVEHTLITKCPVTGDDVFVSHERSVELPEAVPEMQKTLGRVRAVVRNTGYVFRPSKENPNRLALSYFCQVDPRGSFPVSIVNIASVSQAMNAGRVRDLYEQLAKVKKQMGGDVEFPFDCYDLARRGGTCTHEIPLVAPEDGAKTFFVRLRAHSEEHKTTVELEDDGKAKYTLSAAKKDSVGEELVSGKQVKFGGSLDCVLEVTLEDDAAAENELKLKFTNSAWTRKTSVCVPVPMPTSLSNSSVTAAELTATTELEQ